MKILVYGAGVIGCYLTHVLCAAGNDVTLLARGSWRETLERNGLTIVHHLQKKTTYDRPRVIGALNGEHYDLVFAVMQYQQMAAILDDLAQANSSVVVLVGNNMDAGKMETYIQAHTAAPKTVLFGFQGTGGRRETDKAVCVRFGDMGMTVGGAHGEPSTADKQALTSAFADTGYHLTWAADMDAWYKCHLAFILPIVYLSYALDCDLSRATGKQIKTGLQAVREGYGLLDALGYPILPEDTMEKLHGFKGALSYVLLRLMAKTTIGGGFVSTLLFALYNGGLGVWYASLWYGSICAYYILLSLLWCILLTAKRKAGPELGERRRKKVFLMTAVTLLVMNLALCIPVSLMVLNQRPIRAGMVPAITSAAYTTYKISSAVVRWKRTNGTILDRELSTIRLVDALVSVLVLQNTLIIAVDGGISPRMFRLAAVSSAGILLLIFAVSAAWFLWMYKSTDP